MEEEQAFIKSALGTIVIVGCGKGVSKITITDVEIELSTNIPNNLRDAVQQLKDYFEGKRTYFDFKIHLNNNYPSKIKI